MDKEALAKAAGAALASGALGRIIFVVAIFLGRILFLSLFSLPVHSYSIGLGKNTTQRNHESKSGNLGDKGKTAAAALGMSGSFQY